MDKLSRELLKILEPKISRLDSWRETEHRNSGQDGTTTLTAKLDDLTISVSEDSTTYFSHDMSGACDGSSSTKTYSLDVNRKGETILFLTSGAKRFYFNAQRQMERKSNEQCKKHEYRRKQELRTITEKYKKGGTK